MCAQQAMCWNTRPRLLVIATQSDIAAHSQSQLEDEDFTSFLYSIDLGNHFSTSRLARVYDAPQNWLWIRKSVLREELRLADDGKRAGYARFDAAHFAWFFNHAAQHFANTDRYEFSFVSVSVWPRPFSNFQPKLFGKFLVGIAQSKIPLQSVIALIASAVVLDAYPPMGHGGLYGSTQYL